MSRVILLSLSCCTWDVRLYMSVLCCTVLRLHHIEQVVLPGTFRHNAWIYVWPKEQRLNRLKWLKTTTRQCAGPLFEGELLPVCILKYTWWTKNLSWSKCSSVYTCWYHTRAACVCTYIMSCVYIYMHIYICYVSVFWGVWISDIWMVKTVERRLLKTFSIKALIRRSNQYAIMKNFWIISVYAVISEPMGNTVESNHTLFFYYHYYLSLREIYFAPCWSIHWPLTSEEAGPHTCSWSNITLVYLSAHSHHGTKEITREVRHSPLQKAEANLFKYKQNAITHLVISVGAGVAGIRFRQINYLHRLCLWFAMDLREASWQGLEEDCLWLT